MKKLFGILLPALLVACYSPEPFEAEVGDTASQASGSVYPVNTMEQICNPSVSQDTVNFPASMLWLNFGSDLKVTRPDSEYTVSKADVVQHDRLTISDTAGKVLWYMMADFDAGDCQFQDPEWSTHPDYVVALRAYDINGRKSCYDLDYGMFAVRLSDSKKFWFYDKDIIETATPHLWVSPDASVEEDAADSTVEGFFGTKDVRLTYVSEKKEIVFVDFANGGLKKAKTLKKPADRSSWDIDSPLISPDGKFVVYNMLENPATWEAYIQELSPSSVPVKIERLSGSTSDPAQPHWFEYNGRLYVLWTEFPQNWPQMLNKSDLRETSTQDGSVGRTVMREVRVLAGAPVDLSVEWVGEARTVASVPMMGGRSPDGRFLATGTNYGFLLELP